MPRTPRIEYAGALYHLTARGARQADIFIDNHDRVELLTILIQALREFDSILFAFCLMSNHYHLVLQTRRANLSALMQRANSLYCQAFNRRHGRQGHVFDGRFKATHVDRDAYLLEVCRYVDLNPVRAGMVDSPAQWKWSSYRSHAGLRPRPAWLATDELHGVLIGRPASGVEEIACQHYVDWVARGLGKPLWRDSLRHGCYLGNQAFVDRVRRQGQGPAFRPGDRGQAPPRAEKTSLG